MGILVRSISGNLYLSVDFVFGFPGDTCLVCRLGLFILHCVPNTDRNF